VGVYVSLLLFRRNKKKKIMTNEKLIMELINKKDDTELMNMVNTITFPFTDKYKKYTKKEEKPTFDYGEYDG